jgi:hypothetical protein
MGHNLFGDEIGVYYVDWLTAPPRRGGPVQATDLPLTQVRRAAEQPERRTGDAPGATLMTVAVTWLSLAGRCDTMTAPQGRASGSRRHSASGLACVGHSGLDTSCPGQVPRPGLHRDCAQ